MEESAKFIQSCGWHHVSLLISLNKFYNLIHCLCAKYFKMPCQNKQILPRWIFKKIVNKIRIRAILEVFVATMKPFCGNSWRLMALNYFRKKFHHMCWGLKNASKEISISSWKPTLKSLVVMKLAARLD